MVGNDIIEIDETRRSTNWERPGFIKKIFTRKEQRFINNSADSFITVWHLWSMKESAYKVFIQNGIDRFFNPLRIECSVDSLQNGQVRIDKTLIKTNTIINSNYIFTTAVLDRSDIETRIFNMMDINCKSQSIYMQEQVLRAFVKNNSLNFSKLEIHKTTTGVPALFYKNIRLNTSFSITHHGNYGAYSILKN